RQTILELGYDGAVQSTTAFQILLVVERRTGGHQGQAVDVERLADAVKDVGDLRRGRRVADPQTGQAVGLAQGAGNDQVRVAGQVVEAVGQLARLGELDVGLVQHHDHIAR